MFSKEVEVLNQAGLHARPATFFIQKANELDFPLKYQEYIVPDVYYLEKYNRIMGIGHPILALFRRFGYIFRCIRYGHISNIISGIKKRIQ